MGQVTRPALRAVTGQALPRSTPSLGPVIAWRCALRDLELARALEIELLGQQLCCPPGDYQQLFALSDALRAARDEIERLTLRVRVEGRLARGERHLATVGASDG